MNFIAGGFLIVKTVPRAEWMSRELLPSHICSVSHCISPQFPSSSVIEWTHDTKEDRREYFTQMGVPLSREAQAIKWGTDNFDKLFGWPGVFYDLASAQATKAEFFGDDKSISVLGLGLPEECIEDFIKVAVSQSGYLDVIKKNEVLPSGGELLGFELMVTDFGGLSHSWICNSLEQHCFSVLEIRPASNGFLPDLETAKRCNAEISKEEVGSEPGLWLPWAIVRYS